MSKTWLYGQVEIRTKINKLRDKNGIIKRSTDLHAHIQKKDAEIIILLKKIKTLENKLIDMKNQLEVAYGEIYRLNSDRR